MKKILKSKREKIDWLDGQPYLGKYFIYKIKRLIMNVIYKVWNSIDEALLEKYYAEFKFENEDKTFQATLPIILLVRNHNEAEDVIGQITNNLRDTYKLTIIKAVAEEKILTPELYKHKEIEFQRRLDGLSTDKIGTITFESHIGSKIKPNIPTHLGIQGSFVEKIEQIDKKQLNFPIIKNTKNKKPIYQVDEFSVIVKLLKEEESNK